MKVKLLRNTMIAGVPENSGSVIDVEDHVGFLLLNLQKAEEFTEKKANTAKTPNLERMTKVDLETYGKNLGLELDISKTKTELITEIQTVNSTS
tara:strand:- start:7873 stop:8154 length:282 start_codon:yes stop_codon:yes gene_type:complete